MNTDNLKETISACMSLAFEAGKWEGQVELEEHYDREQYSSSIMEVIYATKTAMPIDKHSLTGKQVTINLRSDEWREGVRKSSNEYMNRAINLLLNSIDKVNK